MTSPKRQANGMTTALKIIQRGRQALYILYLGCFAGLYVVFSQPMDRDVDKMFKIGLGIALVVSLGVGIGLKFLEERLTNPPQMPKDQAAPPGSATPSRPATKEWMESVIRWLAGLLKRGGVRKAVPANAQVAGGVFRESVRSVVRAVIFVLALLIAQGIVLWIFKPHGYLGRMQTRKWIELVVSLVVVGTSIRLYAPVDRIIRYYVTAFARSPRLRGGEPYLGNLLGTAGNVTVLVYILVIYSCLMPRIVECNSAFIHSRSLLRVLNVAVFLGVGGMLVMLWRNAQPLVEWFTGGITDRVSTLSNVPAGKCPACNSTNDDGTAFCIFCGADMKQTQAVPPPAKGRTCPKCATESDSASNFCHNCGSALVALQRDAGERGRA
jgi:hypothetical protein